MIVEKYEDIIPNNDMVLVEMVDLDLMQAYQSDSMEVAVRQGEVLTKGAKASLPEHCPELEVGNIAVFTEFAGYHIITKDDKMLKLIRGYDIVGKYENREDMDTDKIQPTADRVLVEEYSPDEGSDLIFNSKMHDPRLTDMYYGKILDVGPSVRNSAIKKGVVVAYAPYVGTIIKEQESDKVKPLKIIVEDDVLMMVKP